MSAALAVSLNCRMMAPMHVVAGTLAFGGIPIFGDRQAFDGSLVFSTFNGGWDDHVGIMLGPCRTDISIFRMAFPADRSARLVRPIDLTFGPDNGT